MNRRRFLADAGAYAALVLSRSGATAQSEPHEGQLVRIHVDADHSLGVIPEDFIGLGYEISSVARPGLLSASNRTYVELVKALGARGVIRIGGNTSDYASFSAAGHGISVPKGTIVTRGNLEELGTFLRTTGWSLIWGLNLGSGTEQAAVEEARAVCAIAKDHLLAFEIGNEPDLFGRGTAHRPATYSYDDYLREYRRYKAALRAQIPNIPFAGPDVADATDWVTRFAVDEGNDLKLLTHHYYRECANPSSTLDKLLHPDPKLNPKLSQLKAASEMVRVPYRICETNSFCGGGKPGVSEIFGSALWVLDFMFTLAWGGAAGVNIETGVNQLGFISSYSPIGDDEHGNYSAKPEYYGMLAFTKGSQGQRVQTQYDAVNLTAYAVRDGASLTVTIINKDRLRDASVNVTTNQNFASCTVLRLTGASLESKDGVLLGGSAVSADGTWEPKAKEHLQIRQGEWRVRVPAASAALMTFQP